MTATVRELAAHCRLAVERPEYADEHENCRGTTTVRLDGLDFTTQRCDCTCHIPQTANRPAAP